MMAVPHPAATRESLLRAEHVHRSFHWFFFQLPQLPEQALRADNYAFVDWLWDYWTAPGFTDEEHLAQVKRMLAVPGALEATLGYYRAMFDPAEGGPGPGGGAAGGGPADRGADPGAVRRRGQAG